MCPEEKIVIVMACVQSCRTVLLGRISHLVEAPLHTADATITMLGHFVEEVLRQVQIVLRAARASINNGCFVLLAVLASDAHCLAAERIRVGIAGAVRVKDLFWDSYDGFVLGAGLAACAEADFVPCQVACVGLAGCCHAAGHSATAAA